MPKYYKVVFRYKSIIHSFLFLHIILSFRMSLPHLQFLLSCLCICEYLFIILKILWSVRNLFSIIWRDVYLNLVSCCHWIVLNFTVHLTSSILINYFTHTHTHISVSTVALIDLSILAPELKCYNYYRFTMYFNNWNSCNTLF